MSNISGTYQSVFIARDGKHIALKQDVTDFCRKYIHPVHHMNWDWSKCDFESKKNQPTVAEVRSIRNVVYKDINPRSASDVDLSSITNVRAIKAVLNPRSKYEQFNMEEFAYALEVELEHGKLQEVNVTTAC